MKSASISKVPDESDITVWIFFTGRMKSRVFLLPGPFERQSFFGFLHLFFRNQVCRGWKAFAQRNMQILW